MIWVKCEKKGSKSLNVYSFCERTDFNDVQLKNNMKIYMKNLKGRLSDSCCLLKDFCQMLLFISFQKKVEINVSQQF